jgi:hypothetical protein
MPYAEFSDVLQITDHAHATVGLYHLSKWFNLTQGNLEVTIFPQFLILHTTPDSI